MKCWATEASERPTFQGISAMLKSISPEPKVEVQPPQNQESEFYVNLSQALQNM